jgi:hypothetical protein
MGGISAAGLTRADLAGAGLVFGGAAPPRRGLSSLTDELMRPPPSEASVTALRRARDMLMRATAILR